ncbi:MAG: preprotein translocase subunit SecY [Candidatus Ryanbacteria bacterium CG10_big_fil_rev_8_21_14_0_10_43_42]|uniref:Protein translocase subunit SecY n=1 Tax=Candidatus Ryanbacteria bacterium CG10_big_fil_rev_8_21_14_0_10_43_42 TaxID=1974864 RepID=A0A2M8KXY4_9BACT|nr:MAG: preprotein translocase subunit SecY [Candidatus Ryanbacteria bacterium CG10_big_fil_rev_8_21_14_0_10_43_42]
MVEKIKHIFRDPELRGRILFVLGVLTVFRITAAIPIPGVNIAQLRSFLDGNQLLGLLNIFSGGALDNLSIAMLGLGPYITGSIIMQLMTIVFPKLKEMYQEDGEAGRQKFNQYSRLLTVPLAFVQGYGLLTLLGRQGILADITFLGTVTNVIIITGGALFLMWLGELISEYGIGNGVSLMIFAGIVAGVPTSLQQTFFVFDRSQIPIFIIFIILALAVIAAIVFITEGERPIPVSYAKRVRGMKMYGGFSTYLPLRVNQAGVIPIIFALSIILFPQMFAGFLTVSSNTVLQSIGNFFLNFSNNLLAFGSFYFILVFFFTYFYTAVTFDPDNIAENLQKSGGFVPGIRPGRPTADYLSHIINRITLAGALFLGVIAVLPFVVQAATGIVTLTLGGTALLIVVSVVLEFIKQIEGKLVMREYE